MEGKELTDNIIRNIVSEVLRECKNHQIRASAEFIAFYISLLQLDPNRGLSYEFLTNRGKVQSFIKYLVGNLGAKDDAKILTLRLQHEFRSYIKELDETVIHFRRRLSSKLYPLLLNIIEQDNGNRGEQLYKKICIYVIMASGLGNPNEKPVFKEALQVLKSILDEEEIDVFPSLQNYIKQEVIGCLVDLITGIRLYNKACKKGGEGMLDLPDLMAHALTAVKYEVAESIEMAVYRAEILTEAVKRNMVVMRRTKDEWGIVLEFKNEAEKIQWEYTRDLAATHRQLSKTFRILLESISELEKHRKTLHDQFNSIIETLNKIVIPTLYQAVTDVFPHFAQLTGIWKELQDDAIRLRGISNIFKIQAQLIFSLKIDAVLEQKQPNDQLLETVDWKGQELITRVISPYIRIHTDTSKITKKDLEFHGYCCWILINTGGALIPANIPLGVVEYKHRYYGFSSKMAANCFCANPESYIMNTIDLARKSVHLIKFLDLEDRLKKKLHIKTLIEKKVQPKAVAYSRANQTDTHFEEGNIDRNYLWNIWEYKAKLLKQSKLMSKGTKATETLRTHQKESTRVQTHWMANQTTQTMSNGATNTKKPQNFFYGLRGIRANYPFVMDLKQPEKL
ncbi:hypothetical protein HUJ04_001932 [Dendroctonus ponderosae]|uniref:Cilia- and flagella-associated protein 206 n=1 Tax=Dendroctonus ponderosae TaxID=77166 RepID=A0AAR5QJ47_DENPD|nr:hypothetical protein HUJ04_001932 [Dendroctonus ponderosae]